MTYEFTRFCEMNNFITGQPQRCSTSHGIGQPGVAVRIAMSNFITGHQGTGQPLFLKVSMLHVAHLYEIWTDILSGSTMNGPQVNHQTHLKLWSPNHLIEVLVINNEKKKFNTVPLTFSKYKKITCDGQNFLLDGILAFRPPKVEQLDERFWSGKHVPHAWEYDLLIN